LVGLGSPTYELSAVVLTKESETRAAPSAHDNSDLRMAIGLASSGLGEPPHQRAFWFPRTDGRSVFLLLNPGKALRSSHRAPGLAIRECLLDDGLNPRLPDDALAALTQPPPPPKCGVPAVLRDVRGIVFTEHSQVRLFAGAVRIIYMRPSHLVDADRATRPVTLF